MDRVFFGVFLLLHGLVHLLYYGHSTRRFELKPGMDWPDGSRVTIILGYDLNRNLASCLLILAAVGFAAGGIGIITDVNWGSPVSLFSAILSVGIFVLFWDGSTQNLAEKGGIGYLINLFIVFSLLILRWPPMDI